MESIVRHTNSLEELNLLKELAKKMGFKSEILSDKEDNALAKAIMDNDATTDNALTLEEAKAFYQSLEKEK